MNDILPTVMVQGTVERAWFTHSLDSRLLFYLERLECKKTMPKQRLISQV